MRSVRSWPTRAEAAPGVHCLQHSCQRQRCWDWHQLLQLSMPPVLLSTMGTVWSSHPAREGGAGLHPSVVHPAKAEQPQLTPGAAPASATAHQAVAKQLQLPLCTTPASATCTQTSSHQRQRLLSPEEKLATSSGSSSWVVGLLIGKLVCGSSALEEQCRASSSSSMLLGRLAHSSQPHLERPSGQG